MKVNISKTDKSHRIELIAENKDEINFINEFIENYSYNAKYRFLRRENDKSKLVIKRYEV